MSSYLFSSDIKPHIYAIYGLVRIADEIVDTYTGQNQAELLDELEAQTETAVKYGYSTNPIVHSFAVTAIKFNIGTDLTRPFFKSMRMDLKPMTYSSELYSDYIHGSAEVIGLMCLKVFTINDSARYEKLYHGAKALGSAYQKVNFLRDMKDDYARLGRVYFPDVIFESFDNSQKQNIEADIEKDFTSALASIEELPSNSRAAVMMSYRYYYELFSKLKAADADDLRSERLRIPNSQKLWLLAKGYINR